MSVAWHSTKWWDWCLSEDEKIGIEPIFTDKKLQIIKSGWNW